MGARRPGGPAVTIEAPKRLARERIFRIVGLLRWGDGSASPARTSRHPPRRRQGDGNGPARPLGSVDWNPTGWPPHRGNPYPYDVTDVVRARRRARGAVGGPVGTQRGGSAALVIRGEPGVGKTALVAHVLRQVMAEGPDVTLLATTAVPTESGLSFGGLLGVLRPVLDGLDALPARQAAALRSAFALGPATDPDRFAVATATLGLLAVAAQRGPLIVFVDDWHWLDPGSAQALAFAGAPLGRRRGGVRRDGSKGRRRRGAPGRPDGARPRRAWTSPAPPRWPPVPATRSSVPFWPSSWSARPATRWRCRNRSPSSARWCVGACTRCQSTSPSARVWPPRCCNVCGPFPNRWRSP